MFVNKLTGTTLIIAGMLSSSSLFSVGIKIIERHRNASIPIAITTNIHCTHQLHMYMYQGHRHHHCTPLFLSAMPQILLVSFESNSRWPLPKEGTGPQNDHGCLVASASPQTPVQPEEGGHSSKICMHNRYTIADMYAHLRKLLFSA